MRPRLQVALLGIALAQPLAGSERSFVSQGSALRGAQLASACLDAASPACRAAMKEAVPRAAAALLRLAEHRHPRAAELAARAADSALPEMRVAAAQAFGQLSVEAPDDALLAELLDDPVPAVRAAARRALYGFNSPRARQLAHRADRFPAGDEASLVTEARPNPATLGVPLPADAVFLHFASDVAAGRYAFVTRESAATLSARLSKAGRGPIAPERFRDTVEPEVAASETTPEAEETPEEEDSGSEMPSAAELQAAMAMAAKVMGELSAHPEATAEEQAALMGKAMGQVQVDAGLGESYADREAFGDAQLFWLELANGLDAVVAVYRDEALGATGIGVHLKR